MNTAATENQVDEITGHVTDVTSATPGQQIDDALGNISDTEIADAHMTDHESAPILEESHDMLEEEEAPTPANSSIDERPSASLCAACKQVKGSSGKKLVKSERVGRAKTAAKGSKCCQFVTCTIPWRIQAAVGSKYKYEMVVFFKTQQQKLKKKKIRFGNKDVPDLRDAGKQLSYTELAAAQKLRYKLSKYIIEDKDRLDGVKCLTEAWPLNRQFWEANYMLGVNSNVPAFPGGYVSSQFESAVQALQEIPSLKIEIEQV